LRTDARFRRYLIAHIWASGYFLAGPFLAIHALAMSGKPESFLGQIVSAQMLGGIAGNILAGILGDRSGGKGLVLAEKTLGVALLLATAVNHSVTGFLVIFFMLGVSAAMGVVGNTTLSMEICPPKRLPTYLAILQFTTMGSILLASQIASILRDRLPGNIAPAALLAAGCCAIAFFLICTVKEPRTAQRLPAIPV